MVSSLAPSPFANFPVPSLLPPSATIISTPVQACALFMVVAILAASFKVGIIMEIAGGPDGFG
jgi:hypothetical protein